MLLTQKIIQDSYTITPNKTEIELDLSLKQLLSIEDLDKYIDPLFIKSLYASTNYIKKIDVFYLKALNVAQLDLSVNHIEKIENLQNCKAIKYLNLANNRIKAISGLETLPHIETLDLSMNYIEKISNLTNKSIKALILSGNSIKDLSGLDQLVNIQVLEMEKNEIESLTILPTYRFKAIKKIVLSFNKIPADYLEELTYIMQCFPTIEELNFQGNEIALAKNYRIRLIQFPNLKILDRLELKDPIRKHAEDIRKTEDFEKVLKSAKEEYLNRLKAEKDLKQNIIDMINQQKQNVEDIFENHNQDMIDDLNKLVQMASELQKKRKMGDVIDIDEKELEQWRFKVIKAEQERKKLYEIALKNQEKMKREYLESKLASTKFTEKLYEIAMQKPEIWREIKTQEWEQVMKENEEYLKLLKPEFKDDPIEQEKYDKMTNEMQDNMMKFITDKIIDDEAKDIQIEREKASNILKNALYKQRMQFLDKSPKKNLRQKLDDYYQPENNTKDDNEKTLDEWKSLLQTQGDETMEKIVNNMNTSMRQTGVANKNDDKQENKPTGKKNKKVEDILKAKQEKYQKENPMINELENVLNDNEVKKKQQLEIVNIPNVDIKKLQLDFVDTTPIIIEGTPDIKKQRKREETPTNVIKLEPKVGRSKPVKVNGNDMFGYAEDNMDDGLSDKKPNKVIPNKKKNKKKSKKVEEIDEDDEELEVSRESYIIGEKPNGEKIIMFPFHDDDENILDGLDDNKKGARKQKNNKKKQQSDKLLPEDILDDDDDDEDDDDEEEDEDDESEKPVTQNKQPPIEKVTNPGQIPTNVNPNPTPLPPNNKPTVVNPPEKPKKRTRFCQIF